MTSKLFSLHYLKVSVFERGKRVLIIANYKMCAHRHIRGPIQERVKRLEMMVKNVDIIHKTNIKEASYNGIL